jgi:hypothetical protein
MRVIPLTQGYYAIVDDRDYPWLVRFKWHVAKRGTKRYACGWVGGKKMLMHRLLCEGRVIDHINGNGLDCRRENLRGVTCRAINNWNTRNRPKGKAQVARYSMLRLI